MSGFVRSMAWSILSNDGTGQHCQARRKAQKPHRDYHFGFQENDVVSEFPISSQILSQFLTLQGAVAHTEMKIESGPTMFLPFSQQYSLGYMAWRETKFTKYFERQTRYRFC